jgi:Ca2+-binding EF-hand superfamily protein
MAFHVFKRLVSRNFHPGQYCTDLTKTFIKSEMHLSDYDINHMQNEFNKVIGNNDSDLNERQFSEFCSTFNKQNKRVEVLSSQIFDAFDKNNDGLISFDEFLIGFALSSRVDLRKRLELAFDLHDMDGNGCLSSIELKKISKALYLMGIDEKLSGSVDKFIDELDVNGDGKVSRGMFQRFISGVDR